MAEYKVVIAGNNADSAWLLRLVIEREGRTAVVGHARNGYELSELLAELSPNVVLLDADASDQATTATIHLAKLEHQPVGFVALTSGGVDEILLTDVDVVVDRDAPLDDLIEAIDRSYRASSSVPMPTVAVDSDNLRAADDLLTLYMADLERNQRELEERVDVMQFRLKGTEMLGQAQTRGQVAPAQSAEDVADLLDLYVGDVTREQRQIEERVGLLDLWLRSEVQEAPVGDLAVVRPRGEAVPRLSAGAAAPAYSLTVDGFFNAQHKVTMNGVEGPLHSHSWRVSLRIRQDALDANHTLLGFADVKSILRREISWLDGKILNHVPYFHNLQPTTENVTVFLFNNFKEGLKDLGVTLDSVTIWESPTNSVTYSES